MTEPSSAEPQVLHRDADFLVVHKPPGLPTSSPPGGRACLVDWVRELDPQLARAHASSRLDAPVSGLVTFALTKRANDTLLQARATGRYGRAYWGVTLSEGVREPAEWSWPISIHPRQAKLRQAGPGRGERPASTRCGLVLPRAHGCLLGLFPRTGRTHQLRVHAAQAGAPLFGDPSYGGPRRVALPDGRVVTAPRVLLHCAAVCFPALEGEGWFSLTAPVDADFGAAWRGLGGQDADLQTSLFSSDASLPPSPAGSAGLRS